MSLCISLRRINVAIVALRIRLWLSSSDPAVSLTPRGTEDLPWALLQFGGWRQTGLISSVGVTLGAGLAPQSKPRPPHPTVAHALTNLFDRPSEPLAFLKNHLRNHDGSPPTLQEPSSMENRFCRFLLNSTTVSLRTS
ncbi:hypothetical protein AAFF_G00324670 [Aldrovandia affinis]|uniref:Uncharacterized protein n=1 Tax=Aldrovandia affinis TaxID=143900 RepID=A0AAD7R6M4_9TELE|nr:hypothetical protein AAFF_G00324670 [Aldrovandia affinis]